ncbi:MAG: DEAD/DEAH box helicase family protein [Lachnospiraceae bacterium]|nr:DEAD/DEAH box helicase family protein [Lachnospiraceae bacterium]
MRTIMHDLNSLRGIVRRLQEENANLKKILDEHGISYDFGEIIDAVNPPDDYDEDQGSRIIPVNLTEDMAKEFYSYFWGRTDVFARRGKNGGYFPQCSARWDNPLCPKARNEKQFCDEDCEYKVWRKLEPWMILKHLLGEKEDCSDVLGVYPLLPDNTCHFLVFDFDNHEKDAYKNDDANTDDLWKSEVDALRRICLAAGVDVLVERSRSGKGAHLWIFFRTAIPALTARAFGYALLDRGALSINLPSFRYYDRMYPSQEVLSNLGNLVALPLQGRALRQGNSAFIDESWNAYPDQWQKLRSVRKISLDEMTGYLQEWNRDQAQTFHFTKYAEKNGMVRPWKKDDRFWREDVIGGELHIVLDDGVYVDGLNLGVRIQNQIKGMATIDNPEFYANRASGRSNYYNLRTISMWKDSEGYIKVPIGLLEKIERKCADAGITVNITDNRSYGRPIRACFRGELREQQMMAALQLEKYQNGILCAPPGFGKTVLAAYLISRRKVNTLILLEKTDLIPQWVDEINHFLEIDEKPPVYKTRTGREKVRDSVIGTLVSGNDKTTGIIDFAMIGSAYHKGEFFENLDSYGMIICDECHHIASAQGQVLMGRVRAKYVYGLSATPERSDHLETLVYMLLGPVRHKYSVKEQADAQGLDRYVYPRFTRVAYLAERTPDIYEADNLIADSEVRNEQIVTDIQQAIESGRTPVVLTKLKRHAELLSKLLQGKADHVYLVYGGQTMKQNQEIKEQMFRVPQEESLVLIATGQKIGEGFNFPRLDTLMLAAPIKFDGRLIQYIGRLNRPYEGKTDVTVYDYVDPHIRFFDRQYRNRLKAYKNLGYQVISTPKTDKQVVNAIYNDRDYMEAFERDLIEADSEIVIASPYLRRSKVERIINLLKTRQEAGVSVIVITMDPEAVGYGDVIELHILVDEMRNTGFSVRLTRDEGERYAVIDRKLVWHGGANLLGKEEGMENLIRVENEQAAAELLEITVKTLKK